MESYILRIYRRGEKTGEELVGTLEKVGFAEVQSFKGQAGLCRVLCGRAEPGHARRGSAKKSRGSI